MAVLRVCNIPQSTAQLKVPAQVVCWGSRVAAAQAVALVYAGLPSLRVAAAQAVALVYAGLPSLESHEAMQDIWDS